MPDRYVIEEWIHYAVHYHRVRWRHFDYIRKHHLYHHGARGRDVAFRLSSGIWDAPLDTRIPSGTATRSCGKQERR